MKTSKNAIKKMLIQASEKHEIKDFSNQILEKAVITKSDQSAKKFISLGWLKTSLITVSSCFILIFSVILIITNINKTDKTFTPVPDYSVSKDESIIGFEALSLGNIMQSELSETLTSFALKHVDDDEDDKNKKGNKPFTTIDYATAVETLNKYMLTVEGIFATEASQIITLVPSDLTDYTYKMSISSIDLNYSIYYNEIGYSKKNKTRISGFIDICNQIYALDGMIINKDDEVETKLTIVTSTTTKIVVQHETEINENEWEYKYYTDNKCLLEVKFEKEDQEVTMEVEDKVNKIDINYVLTNANGDYRVQLDSSDCSGYLTATVDKANNCYKYSAQDIEIKCNRKKSGNNF